MNSESLSNYEIRILHDIVDTPEEGNVDVVVRLDTGEQYGATFFTVDNLRYLFNKFAETGECLNGLYFWAIDMIFVQRLDRWTIERTIDGLVREGQFTKAFRRLNPLAETQLGKSGIDGT